MKQDSFLPHFTLALCVSYVLSLCFWLVLHVFNLGGFIVISALCAFIGAMVGFLAGRRLWLTGLVTLIVRIVVFMLMTKTAL